MEEVQMVPGIVGPADLIACALAVRIISQGFSHMATVVVQRKDRHIDVAGRRRVRTAEVNGQHAVHEHPDIVIASNLEKFGTDNLVTHAVLELHVTHFRKSKIAEMAYTNVKRRSRGIHSRFRSPGPSIHEPCSTELCGACVHRILLVSRILVFVRRAVNGERLRAPLVTLVRRASTIRLRCHRDKGKRGRVDNIQREIAAVTVIVIEGIRLGSIGRYHESCIGALRKTIVSKPLFKVLVVAKILGLHDAHAVEHVDFACPGIRSERKVGIHHAGSIVHGI